jgi:hypothetical protein
MKAHEISENTYEESSAISTESYDGCNDLYFDYWFINKSIL